MKYQNFVNGSYQSAAYTADQEQTVNWYYENMESEGASTRAALMPTPGVVSIATAVKSPGRAHAVADSREFAVHGTSLNEIDVSGTITVRGTVATDANPATISWNGDGGNQLFITSGSNGYCFNLGTNVLTQIAALTGKATQGGFLDGYCLALNANTSTFYISALLDASTWATGTDFAQRSAGPDPWTGLAVNGQFIWLLGDVTSEVWYDTGNSSFPFGLHPSGRVPRGIAAGFSVAVAGGTLVWLSKTSIGFGQVVRAGGFTPEVISDFALETALSSYSVISDAVADVIDWCGHTFYLLSFPTANATWFYDLRTGKWAEWETWMSEANDYAAWRPRFHAVAFGEHRILDSSTGDVYRLDADSATDVDSRPIRRLRRAPCLDDELRRVFFSALELDIEPGVGTATGDGADPQIGLRFSNDGGKTWGSQILRSIGKLGEYLTRVRWTRLGQARRRVFEVTGSAPVPYRITGAYLTVGGR